MTDRNRGPEAGAVAILFLITSWLAVLLRVYVRSVMTKSFGIDDSLAILTLFLFTFYCAFVLDGVRYGTGQHRKDLETEDFVLGMKAWWIAEIGYVSCTTVLKISVGYFLLRVCVKKFQKIIIWVVVSVVTAYSIFYFFIVIFQCRPTSYFWDRFDGLHDGKCVSNGLVAGATYAHSSLSVWADWTLALLPISLVWDLDMNPRTKISVAVILALGALGSAATVVRIPYIYQLTETTDFLYANVDVSIWSTVEPGIGLTACSMATLRPLFKTFLARSRLIGSSNKRASTRVWPQPHQPIRNGYFRSGSRNGNDDVEQLGLGDLRYDLNQGVGNSTTIQTLNVPHGIDKEEEEREKRLMTEDGNEASEYYKRFKRFGSGSSKMRPRAATPEAWDSNDIMTDSSSENSTVPGGLGIKKSAKSRTVME